MIAFLTSSACTDKVPQGVQMPCVLDDTNGLVERLRAVWKPDSRLLLIPACPDEPWENDSLADTFTRVFRYHGMTVSKTRILDRRTERDAQRMVTLSDVILLGSGHVPTQMAFFEQIGLRRLIRDYPGVVVGISAGTMCSAELVYIQPELPGESVDPKYERWGRGLGLTKVMLLPHYQNARHHMLDGRRLFEDISYPDSYKEPFYAMIDGSYAVAQDGHTTIYGETYCVKDGACWQLLRHGEALTLD